MNKEEIMNDMNFRNVCKSYGLNWTKFSINGDVIVLETPKSGIYVFLDENYNTIGIHEVNNMGLSLDIDDLSYGYEQLYRCAGINQTCYLPFPFSNLSLKEIVDLSNRIEIHELNHGHSCEFLVNGYVVDCDNDKGYIGLLGYIKFLGNQVKNYYKISYQMKLMGIQFPGAYTYLKKVTTNVNECINNHVRNRSIPTPSDIINYLGQSYDIEGKNYHELKAMIELLLLEKGINVDSNNINCDRIDIPSLLKKLLKVLNVPLEEVRAREQSNRESLNFEKIDLKSWLESDEKDLKQFQLKKVKE